MLVARSPCSLAARNAMAGRSLRRALATHAPAYAAPLEKGVTINYQAVSDKIKLVKSRLNNRPLTLTEKILYGHLENPEQDVDRGKAHLRLQAARVAIHDANAQMALLQFMTAGIPRVRTPTSVHVDHLITAEHGAKKDLAAAISSNKEVYDFLESACAKYGIAFWRPGAGILHQVIFEQYAYPGSFFIGSDSHTPNAAGLGCLGIGVGGMEAVEVMAGLAYEVASPKVIGVKLTGQLSGWASHKDIILKLASILTVKGGTGHVVEYFGEGVDSLSCTGMGTIGNMGAEIGATSSIFPYTKSMGRFLRQTRRSATVEALQPFREDLQADEGAEYDRYIEINLSELEPHVNGPFTPDLSHPISVFKDRVAESTWPTQLSASHIGSCTNSSYEDLSRASSLAKQAEDAGLRLQTPFFIAPGSEEIRATVARDGILDTFEGAGGTMLANACGACVGQWKRSDFERGEKNSIISSFNRNFVGRQDGNPATHSFVASPELATAFAYAGTLAFNPLIDSIPTPSGKPFRFQPPVGPELPPTGYIAALEYYGAPPEDGAAVELAVSPQSERIQLITPFNPWDGKDELEAAILLKVKGKCTTDHISPAGLWYKYRGHLENISQNLLIGAINSENDKPNTIRNVFTGEWDSAPSTATAYRDSGIKWVIVAGDNYGEGSSREVAALSPRFMGGHAVIAKSFARIHEMNLKKQGLLPLTFSQPEDYERIQPSDKLTISGLESFTPNRPLALLVESKEGAAWETALNHTFTDLHISWFKAGSALGTLRAMNA
ncbi:aconitate hydratase [Leucosporidium creatinivorum]|uniref:Aconitate hydratase, mitochondrial n=1 Tax=Leucosporidium creatinivorum TaxID=106004 RepID=A0A1Y2FD06_9BASI|nr:aconitate hydratase [Leucosporidium creatinivorum]